MASAALDAFNARVDASSLSAAAKNTAKDWGERLYVAAIITDAGMAAFNARVDASSCEGVDNRNCILLNLY